MLLKSITRAAYYVVIGILVLSGFYYSDRIQYTHPPTIQLPVDTVLFHLVDFKDDIANDTLIQSLSKEGYPISYTRSIRTGVCFDNKCRPLNVTLRWNATGRYLGFELPEKEFLSKYDHEPFTKAEYQRLHEILTDSLSALAGFHYNEIVPKADSTYDKVDAVSGATSANVLEHVVEGAAFTTYKVWQIVYGSGRQHAESLTCRSLSPEFIQLLLNSKHPSDKIWALNHIRGFIELTPSLQQSVLTYITNSDYNLTERALNSIAPNDLRSGSLQSLLVQKFLTLGYSSQKLLLNKLNDAPNLDGQAHKLLVRNLASLNGQLISNVLDLFLKHQRTDDATCRSVSDLLAVENSFVSGKAYAFFKKVDCRDNLVKTRLSQYKQKAGL